MKEQDTATMIARVYRLLDDAVLVFNERGEQMSDYQGRYTSVAPRIRRNVSYKTEYFHWFDTAPRPHAVAFSDW